MVLPISSSEDVPARIQYMGVASGTRECVDAVRRLVQCREEITHASLLTSGEEHAFASGYAGTAPAGLSYVLQLLDSSGVEMMEREVSEELMQRLDDCALTRSDVEQLSVAAANRDLYGYIQQRHDEWASSGLLWQSFAPVMPFAIIDARLMDLAREFWDDPDNALLTGYRRLEDIVRARISGEAQHTRLMAQAFMGRESALSWDCDEGEQTARANIFIGVFGTYRNPRAHRERREDVDDQLAEFLVLNQLFRLERTALARSSLPPRASKAKDHQASEST
jgi:hypothetical protein